MRIKITEGTVSEFCDAYDKAAGRIPHLEGSAVRAGLAAVLALPEVRAAIYADVRREVEAKEFDR